MAATNIKFAGYSTDQEAREMTIFLSSRGCLSTSSTSLGNSGNSSKNKIQWCARLTSQGVKFLPHPIIETLLAVWCTTRKGLWRIRGVFFERFHNTEYIWLTAKVCSKVKGGSTELSDFANIVFPDPGGPTIRTLCIQAAAIVRALFATNCPWISANLVSLCEAIFWSFFWGIWNKSVIPHESNIATTSVNDEILYKLIWGIYWSSGIFSSGTKKFLRPFWYAEITEGRIPYTFFTDPSSQSSPKNKLVSISSFSDQVGSLTNTKIATAKGRSNLVPIFLIWEGARFNTILRAGNCIPQFLKVALILSLDSLIEASGRPIISIPGRALFASISTSTWCPDSQIFV